jgi:predicted MPP superfamily phosphohydrolase
VDAAYRYPEGRVFVTPVVSGWVLCAGFALPTLDLPAELPAWKAFMEKLAARFPDVQFFGNHRVSSYAAWGRYQEGRLVRAYAAADDPSINEGARTREEIDLGFDFAIPENPEGDTPDEDDVMALAAAWSLDPNEIAQSGFESGVGWVGLWEAPDVPGGNQTDQN